MLGHYVVFESVGNAVLKEFEVPQPGQGEVLLENDYTVVSAGTERANLVGLPNTGTNDGSGELKFPLEPGYSGSGRVVALGEGVTNLKIGDRVIIAWGGHRSHTIKKAQQVLKIDDDSIDMIDAAFSHIVSFPMLAVRKLKIELGESVMIAGMGILGAFALQLANLAGAASVVVADFNPARRELAMKLGAAAAFSPDEDNFIEKVQQAAGGGGPDAVVEVTGVSAALQQALEYIAWQGRIALLGCTRISDVPIDYYKYVHRRGISLIGAHTLTRTKYEPKDYANDPGCIASEHYDYQTFLKLVAADKIQTRPIISEIVSPEAAHDIYTCLAETENPPLGIVFDWKTIR